MGREKRASAIALAVGSSLFAFASEISAQTITRNFTGAFLGANPPGASFAFTPPDTMGAVGPNHVVELINGIWTNYTKNGVIVGTRSSDTQFWIDAFNNSGTPFNPGIDLTDPRVQYDPISQRWFAVEVTLTHPYSVMVARSNSADPSAGFKAVKFAATASGTVFPDYPTLGIDANGVYVGANSFPDAGGTSVSIFAIPKASLLLSTPTVTNMGSFTQQAIGTVGWTPQPLTDTNPSKGTSAPVLTISSSSPSSTTTIKRLTIGNTGGPGQTLSAATSITVNAYSVPPSMQQPAGGVSATLDSIDGRFQSTVYQVGTSIWATHCINISGRAGLRWYQLDANTNAVLQQGNLSDVNFDYGHPSIAANANGDVVIGFTRSGTAAGATGFAGCYAFVGSTTAGVTSFGSIMTLKSGEVKYSADGTGVNRWGDYSATNVDPADPNLFWTVQEYAKTGNLWGINVTEITTPVVNEFRWKDPVSGSFGTGTNWLTGSVPVGTSHAIFSRPTDGVASYTATISSPQTNDRLSVRQGHVIFNNSSTYTLTNAAIATPSVVIGEFNGTPTLDLTGSGTVSSVNAFIAPNYNSNASVTIQNTHAWANSGDMYVAGSNIAAGGPGSITLASGGSPALLVGGRLKVWNSGVINYNAGSLSAGSLDVATGGQVLLSAGNNKVVRAGDVAVAGTGKVDLTDNSMIVDYGGATPFATIRALLQAGYAGGAWTGNGITSSTAAANVAALHKTALGYAEASDIFTSFPAVFRGFAVADGTAVLIRYTPYGDADLSGTVDTVDFNLLAASFSMSNKVWHNGDFDFSGTVDTVDFNMLAANFAFGFAGPDAGSLVPEPTALALLAALPLIARRRRRNP